MINWLRRLRTFNGIPPISRISLFHLTEEKIFGSLSCQLLKEKHSWCMLALQRAQKKHSRMHPEGEEDNTKNPGQIPGKSVCDSAGLELLIRLPKRFGCETLFRPA
jgi:hypothetical protein